MIDLTPILQAVIILIGSLVTYKLVPWIRSKTTDQQFINLKSAANIAVYAAEQIFSSNDSEKKLEYAIEQVTKYGFNVDTETIRAAVEQAVYEMKAEKELTSAFKSQTQVDNNAPKQADNVSEADYHIPPLEEWPLEMVQAFCEDNGVNVDGCVIKADFISAIKKGNSPPNTK